MKTEYTVPDQMRDVRLVSSYLEPGRKLNPDQEQRKKDALDRLYPLSAETILGLVRKNIDSGLSITKEP